MRHIVFPLSILLLVTSAGVAVFAAETAAPANSADAEPQASADNDQTTEEMLAAEAALEAEEAKKRAATAGDTTAASTPAPSNEDFVPTVQISEDLSVSFPVDI